MTKPNAVILCADERVLPPAAFLADRLMRLNPRDDTDIIVFTPPAAARTNFGEGAPPFEVRTIGAAGTMVAGLPDQSYFVRFSAIETLKDRRRLLYLDTDTYPEDATVFSLLDLDLGGAAIAGVRDLVVAYSPMQKERNERAQTIGADQRKYLNTGVLLIDVPQYRSDGILSRLVELIRRRAAPLIFHDQSAMNDLLRGNWAELSPSFNMMAPLWQSALGRVFDPVIRHFAGAIKPWHGSRFTTHHPARHEIEAYLRASPWKAFLPPDSPAVSAPSQPPAAARSFDIDFVGRPAFLHDLRHTRYADVEQHVTTPHWENFPTS